MKITVVGTGYVGLVAGVCFADAGHNVTCIDIDPEKIAILEKGEVPIYEPGLSSLMKPSVEQGRLNFTTDLTAPMNNSDVTFIAVGTPMSEDGSANLNALMKVAEQISNNLSKDTFVVIKSTVPVGTAKMIQEYFDKNCSKNVEVINNPEFLKEGAAVDDFLRPDRVIIGCKTTRAREVMDELYEPFLRNGNPIYFMDNTSAEMSKYAANCFLSVKISFINELARLADKVGADIDLVRRGFTSDSRINPAFFYPGAGYGGSCFPKDVRALIKVAENNGMNLQIVQAADEVNNNQKHYIGEIISNYYKGNLSGKTFAVWGLSFKPRTDDMREAPSLVLIDELASKGAKVVAYDPVAGNNAKKSTKTDFILAKSAMEATEGADGLIVVTEWNEFRNPNYEKLKENLKDKVIFDGRNVFDPHRIKNMGFDYFCIGRQIINRG